MPPILAINGITAAPQFGNWWATPSTLNLLKPKWKVSSNAENEISLCVWALVHFCACVCESVGAAVQVGEFVVRHCVLSLTHAWSGRVEWNSRAQSSLCYIHMHTQNAHHSSKITDIYQTFKLCTGSNTPLVHCFLFFFKSQNCKVMWCLKT